MDKETRKSQETRVSGETTKSEELDKGELESQESDWRPSGH